MNETIIKPKRKVEHQAEISEELSTQLESQVITESQVTVHCTFNSTHGFNSIRIWESTFLLDKDSNHSSKLVETNNITLYPVWTFLRIGEVKQFTLFFNGLPKGCKKFDLVEIIPESGGFEILEIDRNESDVYNIEIK